MKYYSFYLPQYHPIPENDNWWGNNFTEWFNVTKAKPLFKGHYQPHLPKDVGFYDLRLDSIRQMQADMAKKYLVDGFIYYHYWFHGKKLLNQPIEMLLSNEKIDMNFAVCWANENWTRAWDGLEREMLIKQEYSENDNNSHYEYLIKLFKDRRYIKIGERPLFIIYRPLKIENFKKFVQELRAYIIDGIGLNPLILGVRDSSTSDIQINVMNDILDGVIDFQPNSQDFPVKTYNKSGLYALIKKILPNSLYQYLKLRMTAQKKVDYSELVENKIQDYKNFNTKMYPCVFPSWDNTPRRNTPTIIQNNDGKKFSNWLHFASLYAKKTNDVVFINAWNEWAEGCHLEPDIKNGYKFLNAIRETKIEVEAKQ